jgi:hypothetical protein
LRSLRNVRLVVVSACVAVLTTAPALACPRDVLCVVQPTAKAAETPAATRTPAVIPDVRTAQLPSDDRLTLDDLRDELEPGEIEMPWIWRVLREQVHARLPKYEEQRFSLVLSPVVVTSPSDTIPGVGVGGYF